MSQTHASHSPIGVATFLAMLLSLAPAEAQVAPPGMDPAMPEPILPSEEASLPGPETAGIGRDQELDALFVALALAPEDGWKPIQSKIMAVWARSDSAAMTLLLSRATKAMRAGQTDKAMVLLDDLVRLAPDFAEGWNRRATLHFMNEDYGRSVADIQHVLALEPRHFGALSGLGIIFDRLERDEEALAIFRRALEVHPHLEGAQEAVDKLTPLVDGREL